MLRFNLAGQLEDVRCENELLEATSRGDQCDWDHFRICGAFRNAFCPNCRT